MHRIIGYGTTHSYGMTLGPWVNGKSVIDLSGLHAILSLKDNWRTSKVIHNGQWQLIISEVTEIWTQIVNVPITGNEDARR